MSRRGAAAGEGGKSVGRKDISLTASLAERLGNKLSGQDWRWGGKRLSRGERS